MLNKTICVKCKKDWNFVDNSLWTWISESEGYVKCPLEHSGEEVQYWYSIVKNPPDFCPYSLEHAVS